ncbi:hypothetical protein FACS1894152_3190 [Bacilli bacterium]|nr:hypothetical protein FACS1894152_3190 [Bacilli bacterium]
MDESTDVDRERECGGDMDRDRDLVDGEGGGKEECDDRGGDNKGGVRVISAPAPAPTPTPVPKS